MATFIEVSADVSSLTDTLNTFINTTVGSLSNPAVIPQHFSEVVANIKLDNILTQAVASANNLGGFSRGAITSSVYKAAGILREASVVTSTKSNLYSAAEIIMSEQAVKQHAISGLTTNMIRGSTPQQV